jgi:hypothetical protein
LGHLKKLLSRRGAGEGEGIGSGAAMEADGFKFHNKLDKAKSLEKGSVPRKHRACHVADNKNAGPCFQGPAFVE